jgi:hypothetical protein
MPKKSRILSVTLSHIAEATGQTLAQVQYDSARGKVDRKDLLSISKYIVIQHLTK